MNQSWSPPEIATGCTVTRLSVTPVKGLDLHHPDSIQVTCGGVVGDRLFYLIDHTGRLQSCTANPALYGLRASYDDQTRLLTVQRGEEVLQEGLAEPAEEVDTDMWGLRTIRSALVADPVWSTFFSDILGKRVQLVKAHGSAYDVQPVTVLGTASVNELASQAALGRLDSRRFRMLIEFSGGEPHVEDTWGGSLLDFGDAVLRGGEPVKRCAATTRNPESGRVDLQTLRHITAYRGRQNTVLGPGPVFGVYADVVRPGRISVGNVIEVRP